MSELSQALSDLGPRFQFLERSVTQTTGETEVQLCTANALRWLLEIQAPRLVTVDTGVSTVPGNLARGIGRCVAHVTGGTVSSFLPFERDFRRHALMAQQLYYGGYLDGTNPSSPLEWTVFEVLLVPG
jgi:hypothetical protein